MKHAFYRRLLSAVCAIALAFTAVCPAVAAAPEGTPSTPQTLTTSEVQEMQQTDAAVTALTDSAAYADMSETERQAAALAQLDALAAQGLVKKDSIYVDAENGMISFAYSCGAWGGILLTDTESEADAALPGPELPELEAAPALLTAENGTVGNAVIYYAFDNGVNSNRYPYYSYMKDYWNGSGLDTHLDMMVTVSDLKRMTDYDLAILSAHGAYYTYEYGWLWKKTATEPLILLTEQSNFWSDFRYGLDLLSHRVVKINGMYAATGAFFSNAYRGSGIVLSETCEFYGKNGHVDTSIADGLLAGGAKAVAGYVNNVYSVYSRSMLWDMVNRMIAGDTLEQAADDAKETYGTDDIIWYSSQGGRRPHAAASYLMLSGDHTVRLPGAPAAAPAEQQAA